MLVIGFGNPRHRDQAIGYQAAEMLGGLACFYLTHDLARTVASTDRVIFLDAAPGALQATEVVPEEFPSDDVHTPLTPAQLLGVARRLYGQAPKAWVIRGGASDLGMGEALSASGLQSLQSMMTECDRLSREPAFVTR
jgi:hydrogenase maturation protease